MNKELAETIVDACENCGVDAEVYDGYSGRGMYGERTFAVTTGSDVGIVDILAAVIQCADMFVVDGETFDVRSLRSDSMGRGVVIY